GVIVTKKIEAGVVLKRFVAFLLLNSLMFHWTAVTFTVRSSPSDWSHTVKISVIPSGLRSESKTSSERPGTNVGIGCLPKSTLNRGFVDPVSLSSPSVFHGDRVI